jgi:hypothetical protein
MNNGTWDQDLSCCWLSIESLPAKTLRITLAEGNCCDMDGAIRFAKKLMPDVARIVTMSGGHLDTHYSLGGTGTWQAHPAR